MSALLLAEATVSLPITLALTLGGVLFGGAVAWGAMATTVRQLRDMVSKLETAVSNMTHAQHALDKRIVALEAREEANRGRAWQLGEDDE